MKIKCSGCIVVGAQNRLRITLRNVSKIFDWLPCSWQQSAFSGNRCTAQFPIPQVRVPSHSSSLSQSPSWIPHLLWIVQQFHELPLPLQVSWPLQVVASSHATIEDKKNRTCYIQCQLRHWVSCLMGPKKHGFCSKINSSRMKLLHFVNFRKWSGLKIESRKKWF